MSRLALLAASMLLSACAESATVETPAAAPSSSVIDVSTSGVAASAPAADTTTSQTEAASTSAVGPFALPVGPWRVGDTLLCLLEASTPDTRARGLMGVTEFSGGVDGMAFLWDEDAESAFTMEGTLIPLDIAWFDASGNIVPVGGDVVTTMQPCEVEECPLYGPPDRPHRLAVEAAAGRLADLTTGSRMLRNPEGC